MKAGTSREKRATMYSDAGQALQEALTYRQSQMRRFIKMAFCRAVS